MRTDAVTAMTGDCAPPASSEQALRRMKNQPRSDTGCELRLRSALHRLGLRYRVHVRPETALRREADIVFRPARVAVFVDGCFWHGCPIHKRPSKSHSDWWIDKIDKNRLRDQETGVVLAQSGWTVIRIWEHADSQMAAAEIARVVRAHTAARRPSPRTPS